MTSSTASRQGVAAEGIFIGLLVRNTFIDDVFWDVESCSSPSRRKRHSSAPPRTPQASSTPCSTFAKMESDACHSEDESTQGGADSTISDGQSSDAGFQDDAESVTNEGGDENTPCVEVKPRWSDDDAWADDLCIDCDPTPPVPKTRLQLAAKFEPAGKTSLKSSAKAWAPALEASKQLDSVINQVKAAVSLAGFGAAVQVTRTPEGTTITAYVGQARKDAFVGVAQNAFIMASQAADQIYLLGYRTNPFVVDATGFSTTFGEMGDPQAACWDLYQHGWCKNQWHCRWHHPTWTRQVTVKVV